MLGRFRKRPAPQRASAAAAETGDQLGEVASRHRTVDEIAWHRRVIAVFSFVCIGLVILVVLTFDAVRMLMTALQDKQVVVATVEGRNGIAAEVGPVEFGTDRARDIQESLAIGYLRMWFEVIPDIGRMHRRWATDCLDQVQPVAIYNDNECGYMYTHSTRELYEFFLAQPMVSDGLVTQMIDDIVYQKVELTADPIWHAEDRLELRFRILQEQGRSVISERFGLVNMQFTFDERGRADRQTRFLNPHNFRVVRFVPAEVSETERRTLQ